LFKLLSYLIKREVASVDEVKRSEDDIRELIKQLANDELLNEFKQNPLDINSSHIKKNITEQEAVFKIEHCMEDNDSTNNYDILEPYLLNNTLNLDLKHIKQKCLFDFQNDILFKITKLQKQYDQEKIELLSQMSLLRRKSTGNDNSDKNDFNREIGGFNEKEALKAVEKHKFNVDVLTQRINHLKFKAENDYYLLKAQLENDPRLKPK
jgi:hypothetical protein